VCQSDAWQGFGPRDESLDATLNAQSSTRNARRATLDAQRFAGQLVAACH
jgi:hypothetical protein